MQKKTERSYYLGVSLLDARGSTLRSLLEALEGTEGSRWVAVCCSSRDSLEEAVAALRVGHGGAGGAGGLRWAQVSELHSDLLETERDEIIDTYSLQRQQQEVRRQQQGREGRGEGEAGPGPGGEHSAAASASGRPESPLPTGYYSPRGAWHAFDPEEARQRRDEEREMRRNVRHVLCTTDAGLRSLGPQHQLGVSLLVHYDLPTRKEVYAKRYSVLQGYGRQRRVSVHVAVAGRLAELRAVEALSPVPLEGLPIHAPEIFA